jgi:hypothetical protein
VAGVVTAAASRAPMASLALAPPEIGILIAANGVTGNSHELSQSHQLLARALNNGIRILVITRAEIETLTHSDDLVRLLKTKLIQLVLRQTSL